MVLIIIIIIVIIFSYVILYYPTIISFIYKLYYIYIRHMYVLTEFIPATFLDRKSTQNFIFCAIFVLAKNNKFYIYF